MFLRGLFLSLVAAALALPVFEAHAQTRAAPDLYVVVLATAASTAQRPPAALPEVLRGHSLYWRQVKNGSAPGYQLCLGFFATRGEADRARRQLEASFRGARVISVNPRERDHLLKVRQMPAPAPAAAPATTAPTGSAEALMTEGRAAIVREDYAAAIRAFTQLLALPENGLTRDAREFLALSYERAGDVARAKLEYENYLKRYPDGEDSVRVRQRLANLRPAPAHQALHTPTQMKDGWRAMTFGSVSQVYYSGNSKIDTLTQQPTTNTLGRTTLSLTDQSALISNVDLSARYLNETHDNRFVFRDTDAQNYIAGQNGRNRLDAAYYEYKYKPADLSARIGRQPGYTGGLLGRFDGAVVGYGLTPRVRLNVVGGEPVDYGFTIDSKRRFYGINTDLGLFDQHWAGNLYVIRQTVDGIPDREATGAELRYFAPQGSFASLVDYDTLFRETNIVTLQGNWQTSSKTSFNLLIDRRKTPSLQTTTATFGEATTSIQTLLATYSAEELRQRAKALTATATMASIGFTHPVTRVWQLGADYRVARISGTDGTNNMPAMPGTGNVHTVGAQAIGTGLLARRDVTAISASRVIADTYRGAALGINTHAPIGDRWMLGASVLLYAQRSDNGSTIDRLFATLRSEYRWKANVTLEAEIGADNSRSKGPFGEENIDRRFFSLGYRWDF